MDIKNVGRRVILESPYMGDVAVNQRYARACLRELLLQGDRPLASHLLYTQEGVLDDTVPAERLMGIEAVLSWLAVADASIVYVDLGLSSGMIKGIDRARSMGLPVEPRRLAPDHLDRIGLSQHRIPIIGERVENAEAGLSGGLEKPFDYRCWRPGVWVVYHRIDGVITDVLDGVLDHFSVLDQFAVGPQGFDRLAARDAIRRCADRRAEAGADMAADPAPEPVM